MEHYSLLKMAHSLPGILLLLGLLAHCFMLWKARRKGDEAVLQRKLRNTLRYSFPALGLLALSLPVSGWWLVHLAGFPLGQTWLLLSSLLFAVLVLFALLLAGRLAAWLALGTTPPSSLLLRLASAYVVMIFILLLAIMALMGAKPV
jgi:uncharacterized membrane protein